MIGLLETLAIAIAAILGAVQWGRIQRKRGEADASARQFEAQRRRNDELTEDLAHAANDKPSGAVDARQRLRAHADRHTPDAL